MESRFHLLFVDGERQGEVIPLAAERFTIGRKEKNDLVLADSRVSGVHAEVVREGEDWLLRDLGSTNGTLLDGRKIEEVPLAHGDIFSIGLIRLRFVDGEGGPLAEESEEVQVARVDEETLSRAGQRRSMLPLVLLLVVVAGGGLWAWFHFSPGEQGGGGPQGPRAIPDNLIPLEVAAMEGEADQAWDGSGGKQSFRPERGMAHSGEGCWVADLEGEGAALLTLRRPLPANPGRELTGGAFLRVRGERVRAALHLRFHAEGEEVATARAPSAWVGEGDYRRVAVTATVPAGCEAVTLQAVALGGRGEVSLDDAFLLRGGGTGGQRIKPDREPLAEICLNRGVLSVSHTGAARVLAMSPVLFRPGTREDALAARLRLGWDEEGQGLAPVDGRGRTCLVLTRLTARPIGAALRFSLAGTKEPPVAPRLLWGVPEGVKAVPLPAREDGQEGVRGLRLEAERDALLITWSEPAPLAQTAPVGGRRLFHLPLPRGEIFIQADFDQEKVQAMELLRRAREELEQGRSGRALVALKRLLRDLPYDDQVVQEASELSSRIVARGMKALESLKEEAMKVRIFSSAEQLEELARRARAVAAEFAGADRFAGEAEKVAEEAAARLAEIRRAADDREYRRLRQMLESDGLGEVLRAMIDDYIDRHLAAARRRAEQEEPTGGAEGEGERE